MYNWVVTTPKTDNQWQGYYDLRWRVLRKPWSQERGTERDDLENNSIHSMVLLNLKNQTIGVGRAHLIDKTTAQIRYMAVDPDFVGKGVGSSLLASLEEAVKAKGAGMVILHSRESALGFYKSHGYQLIEKSHVLYHQIVHYLMRKRL